ncbi:MAG: dihydrolipoyl dehydrogenase [Oligoflexia bacterium]|nr:dihydrolipoyl dehydrogenase [Oligoflexia bacterium]
MKTFDVCVIGAGPGGYVAAIKAAQLGKKVVVVEREKIGGVCLNCGCIPSKAMITAAHMFEKMSSLSEIGLSASNINVDMTKIQNWKESVVNKLTTGVSGLFKMNGIESIMGEANFVSAQELELNCSNGEKEIIKASNYIIANGSRPIEIPGFNFDGKNVLSSTEALTLNPTPKRLVVIGGGYIGLEIGSYLSKFGCEVTVLEANSSLLSGVVDTDCVNVVARKLKKKGVNVMLGAKAKGYKKVGNDLQVELQTEKGIQTVLCDKILVTVGRKPNSDQMNLSKIGIKVDQKGFVVVNKQLRTNISHIFAIGDVAGQPMLAHKASREGIIAAEVIAGKNAIADYKFVPAVIFTDPEIASVGLTVEEATQKGFEVATGQFPYAANGRALSVMDAEGFVKIVADKKTNVVLGVHIVGYEASNLISEAALAIEMGATLQDIASTIHPHPTLPEMMMEAAEAAMGHPIHIFLRPKTDRAARPTTRNAH